MTISLLIDIKLPHESVKVLIQSLSPTLLYRIARKVVSELPRQYFDLMVSIAKEERRPVVMSQSFLTVLHMFAKAVGVSTFRASPVESSQAH